MATRNRKDKRTSYSVSEKRMSQWEELMRKFSRAHQEKCRLRPATLNIPRTYRSTKYFPTGSQYAGTWDMLGMSGRGVYTFPNGVVYEGEFEDGMFHGKGLLRYEDGATLRGTFHKGVMIERKLTFAEGLEYEEEDWMYCKMPDRRFAVEYDKGLQPAGKSNITSKMPPREIPQGFYDTGDGFYNPATKSVYNPDDPTAILRSPAVLEQRWILENCRVAPDPVLGPRQHLYEKWSEPLDEIPPVPPPAADIHTGQPSRQPSVYEEEYDILKGTDFYNPNQADTVPPKWRHIKRVSASSARRESSKMSCEPIQSRTRALHDLYMKSMSSNEKDEYTPAKKVVRVEPRSSFLYACFPSSVMMFIADEDNDFFDSTSYRVDPKL